MDAYHLVIKLEHPSGPNERNVDTNSVFGEGQYIAPLQQSFVIVLLCLVKENNQEHGLFFHMDCLPVEYFW